MIASLKLNELIPEPCSNGWVYDNVFSRRWVDPRGHRCWLQNLAYGMNDGNQAGPRPWPGNSRNLGFFNAVGYECNDLWVHDPMNGCRIGEAKNPGPFQVSCLNIQSLNAAVNEARIAMPEYGILALSETSATQVGLDKAGKMASSKKCHSFHSKPSKYRNYARGLRSEARGEATGTWVASSQHARPLHDKWPDDIWDMARACDAVIYTPMGPIYVACLYGLHQCLPDSYATTDRILECFFHRAELQQMPAIICGDLNAPLEELTTWESMQARSWMDAAVVQASRDGLPPRNTYKEATRIDYILMNKFAARAFQDYWVSELPITDHRQLYANFQWEKPLGFDTFWKMPADLRLAGISGDALQAESVPAVTKFNFEEALKEDDVDGALTVWLSAIEYTANHALSSASGKGLHPSFKGKHACKFVQRQAAKPYVKRGRDDTIQLDARDLGTLFRQRVKQVRRMDAYIAQLKHPHPLPPSRCTEASKVWHSILNAAGFSSKFPLWCLNELETCCPLDPPPLLHAQWLRSQLAQQVPRWPAKAEAERQKYVRRKFNDDWTKGGRLSFQALKPAIHPPVDAIDRSDRICVRSLRTKKKGMAVFRLEHEDMHLISIGQVWKQGHARGFVTAIKDDLIHVRGVDGVLRSGSMQTQTTCHDPQQALRLAMDYWSSFWNDPHVTDLQDPDVVALCDSLPSLPVQDPTITMYELESALRTLPVNKARGMDGVTNWELRNSCRDLRVMLLALLNKITADGRWPSRLLRARMHLIRKTQEAGEITSTRPICILPNLFRLWGKIMTSKCFRCVLPMLPPSLVGSVPGRSATDLAMQLQIDLENQLMDNKCVFGAALDLHKAFNTLDRGLLNALCKRLGLHNIWKPYSAALSGMQRYFVVRNSWSAPLRSTTGVPEGCPLSVVMMAIVIVTWAITNALSSNFPEKTLHSYVDDWTLRDDDPKDLLSQLWFVKKLTDKLGLKLSMTKTVMYATTGPARKRLSKCIGEENLQLAVHDTCIGLGVEFQARGRRVTSVRNLRVEKVVPLLNKLRVMPWTSSKKASVLVRGVFPALFHGCEFHDMGALFLRDVRARSNGAIWKGRQYMSHYLSPILSTKTCYEPWIWILRKCFMSFLRVCSLIPDAIKRAWNSALPRALTKHTLGPVTVLMAHLKRLGWTLADDLHCRLPDGRSFRLDHISSWQFKRLATESWETWIIPKVKHRCGFEDLTSFTAEASNWDNDDHALNGFMMTLRSGGLFTNRSKAKFTGCSDKCALCDQTDGMLHRIYECPGAAGAKAKVDWTLLQELPKHSLMWGIFGLPEAQERYWQALDNIPATPLQQLQVQNTRHQIFTDGSCGVSKGPHRHAVYAAWAIRLAEPNSAKSTLLASGPLPGRKQTAYRSEIYAVINALSVSTFSDIYTDCYNVYRGVLKLQTAGWIELDWKASPDIDLWKTLWRLLAEPGRQHGFYWVRAHRLPSDAKGTVDLWCILQNRSVDASADIAINPLPEYVEQVRTELCGQNDRLHKSKLDTARYLRSLWDLHNAQ